MAPPRIEKIITALDVGSWKVCALIAGRPPTASSMCSAPASAKAAASSAAMSPTWNRPSISCARRSSRPNASRASTSTTSGSAFSAGGLISDVAPIESELGGHRIEKEDVDDLLAAGRAGIDPEGRMILHAQPALYTLDGLNGVKNPIGLHADRLGVDIHIIMADGAPVRNLEAAVRQAHLDVNAVVASPIAAGLACLSDEERDLGVALVELGAAVTTVSLYAGGMLVEMASLPFGASDITDDIASAFGIRRSQAQRLQSFYGSASASPRDNNEIIELEPGAPTNGDSPRITRAQLVSVIRQRLDAMMGRSAGRSRTCISSARSGVRSCWSAAAPT
jgi:cell division protein FtsA